MQPSDEDAQCNVLPDDEIERKRSAAAQKTPRKEDSKPAAQSEAEESPLSVDQPINRLRKRHHESEAMEQLFADLARDNQKQFKEQEEKHTMEIAALKRANLDTKIF
jgi:glutamine synthetase adenylyltransferase